MPRAFRFGVQVSSPDPERRADQLRHFESVATPRLVVSRLVRK